MFSSLMSRSKLREGFLVVEGLVGIRAVRQQGEVQVRVAVGEIAYLEVINQLADLRFRQQECRHRDNRLEFVRNPPGEVQFRKRSRR